MALYFNRELSWIEFNARVLNEACKKNLPLLERMNFLSIVSSNFDEFFQVRVASIKRNERQNPLLQDPSGYTPSALLKKISERCHQIQKVQQETLNNDLLPALAQKGKTEHSQNQSATERTMQRKCSQKR